MKFKQLPIFITFPIFLFSCGNFYEKPNNNDIIGAYKISKITSSQIDKNNINKYFLTLHENGEFEMTKIPILNICEKGKYELDYNYEFNELTFQCGNQFSTAHIDTNVNNYEIEFIIGDPDSGESIYFEKIK